MQRFCSQCKRRDSLGVYQLSDYYWICEQCNQQNKTQYRNLHTILDWDNKQTVNSIDEALNYFNFLQSGRLFNYFGKLRSIPGDKGIICHETAMQVTDTDPLGLERIRTYYYYVCYNREYLKGFKAAKAFERPSKKYHGYDWQTVHSQIVAQALQKQNSPDIEAVRIVIVMKSKAVWYVDPKVIRGWADNYECERIPFGETMYECSIPVVKLENYDHFFIPRQEEEQRL